MKKSTLILLTTVLISTVLYAKIDIKKPVKSLPTSFAIVIDKITYEKTEKAVLEYRDAVEYDGLSTYILIVDGEKPSAIKEQLNKLYNSSPKLEGAVFVGDVPVAMILDAQHFTSAFKMDQDRFEWIQSSVPSDRFYEDFDLKFQYIRQDSSNSTYYYYTLKADSPQRIIKDIYSGRIKSPFNDDSKYELISKYLKKAAKAKYNEEVLDHMLNFTGQGYNSEALTTWSNEYVSLREQFPQLYLPGGELIYLQFRMNSEMKSIIMSELEREEMDIAIFHAHGDIDRQFLLSDPLPESVEDNIEAIKSSLRSRLRYVKSHDKDIEEAKKEYIEKYNIPEEWISDAFDPAVEAADSVEEHSRDLFSDDLSLFDPQAEFVLFDECFNGAFINENYISGRYIFNDGNVIVGCANSVNVIQDKWANKFLGMFNYGARVGKWHKYVNYLENHLIGDPTFHFKNTKDVDLNKFLNENEYKAEPWEKLLDCPEHELRSLAVYRLTEIKGQSFNKKLVEIYNTDPAYAVRLQVLNCLARLNSEDFRELLPKAAYDPYEFIRRKATYLMGETGDSKYIPVLLDRMVNDQGDRISFVCSNALALMDQDDVLVEINKMMNGKESKFRDYPALKSILVNSSEHDVKMFNNVVTAVMDTEKKESKRVGEIRMIRNFNCTKGIDDFIKVVKDKSNPELIRTTMIEALGWFTFNNRRNEIIAALDDVIKEANVPSSVKDEALKSKSRLITGSNSPLTP